MKCIFLPLKTAFSSTITQPNDTTLFCWWPPWFQWHKKLLVKGNPGVSSFHYWTNILAKPLCLLVWIHFQSSHPSVDWNSCVPHHYQPWLPQYHQTLGTTSSTLPLPTFFTSHRVKSGCSSFGVLPAAYWIPPCCFPLAFITPFLQLFEDRSIFSKTRHYIGA